MLFVSLSPNNIPAAPPLVAGATTFPPIQGALWALGSVPHGFTSLTPKALLTL